MLVKFHSQAGQSILMFENDARTLLRMMGMSGDIPGAVAAEDVGAALDRLDHSLENGKPQSNPVPDAGGRDDASEAPVGMSVRAYPLVQLLQIASRRKRAVVWEAEN